MENQIVLLGLGLDVNKIVQFATVLGADDVVVFFYID
jgi:hypothetical protein